MEIHNYVWILEIFLEGQWTKTKADRHGRIVAFTTRVKALELKKECEKNLDCFRYRVRRYNRAEDI